MQFILSFESFISYNPREKKTKHRQRQYNVSPTTTWPNSGPQNLEEEKKNYTPK